MKVGICIYTYILFSRLLWLRFFSRLKFIQNSILCINNTVKFKSYVFLKVIKVKKPQNKIN